MGHVWVQNGPFAQTSLFSEKSLILFSLTCWPISLCKIFKNFWQWTKSYEDAPFLGPKMEAHLPKRKFFQKIWFLSFMSIYTPKVNVRYQSINEILTIKEWLRAIFGHNLRTWFFPGMYFSQNVEGPWELSIYTNSRQN